jgi:hypothetical protein
MLNYPLNVVTSQNTKTLNIDAVETSNLAKIKVSYCLIKHFIMEGDGVMEVHAPAALTTRKDPPLPIEQETVSSIARLDTLEERRISCASRESNNPEPFCP